MATAAASGPRRLGTAGVRSGLGLLCCGITVFGFSASSAAQGAYTPAPNPFVGGVPAPAQAVAPPPEAAPPAPGAGPNAPAPEPAAPEAQGGVPPAWIFTPLIEVGETYNDN